MFNLRSHLLWIVTPLTLIVTMGAGIASATVEEAAHTATPPARPSGEASAVRPQAYAVAGRVVFVDLPSRMLIVQRRDGKFVDVFIAPRTVIRMGGKAMRPADLRVGDRVAMVGKPHAKFGIDAAVMTVAARSAAANSPPK